MNNLLKISGTFYLKDLFFCKVYIHNLFVAKISSTCLRYIISQLSFILFSFDYKQVSRESILQSMRFYSSVHWCWRSKGLLWLLMQHGLHCIRSGPLHWRHILLAGAILHFPQNILLTRVPSWSPRLKRSE